MKERVSCHLGGRNHLRGCGDGDRPMVVGHDGLVVLDGCFPEADVQWSGDTRGTETRELQLKKRHVRGHIVHEYDDLWQAQTGCLFPGRCLCIGSQGW